MLKAMRHHARYFYVLFFIVILSFIFWGVGTVDKADKNDIVAEVDKYKITSEEYWRYYDRALKFYKEIYKEKFDDEMQKKLKLKENVLNSLIENRVLLIAAKNNGISISDDELNEAITNEPAFMKDGVFDTGVYQNRLKLLRLTPEGFESIKRQELTATKIRRMIELSAAPDTDLAASSDEQTMKALREAMANNAREQAVKAYVAGLKKGMKIKIYQERLA